MSRPFSPEEPARQRVYRRLYLRTKQRLDRQDDILQYLMGRIDGLQKRFDKLEDEKKSQADVGSGDGGRSRRHPLRNA